MRIEFLIFISFLCVMIALGQGEARAGHTKYEAIDSFHTTFINQSNLVFNTTEKAYDTNGTINSTIVINNAVNVVVNSGLRLVGEMGVFVIAFGYDNPSFDAITITEFIKYGIILIVLSFVWQPLLMLLYGLYLVLKKLKNKVML